MKMIKVKEDVHQQLKEMKKGSFSETIGILIEKSKVDRKKLIKEAVKEAIQEERNA